MRFLSCFAFRGELSILPCMLLVWHPLSQVFSKHIQSKIGNKRFSVETVAQSEQPHGARETSTAPTSSRFDTLINESNINININESSTTSFPGECDHDFLFRARHR